MSLRIGIDAHAIGERKTGNERVIANLIPALRRLCDHRFVLYFTHPEAAEQWRVLPNTEVRLLRPSSSVVRIPVALPVRAARDRLDVLLVQYTAPPVVGCPVVTVVHDVAFALFPHFYTRGERVWMRRTIPATMRRAAAVVTVSEFSKREILRVYGIPPGRVVVAPNGVAPVFLDPAPRPAPQDPPFFLTVGNLQPRKNVATLVQGYRRAVELRPGLAERLVVVGQEWSSRTAGALLRETTDLRAAGRVAFTGYVSDHDLVGLLQRATAFAYPSLYEGFGLPVVEAMAAGAPVLASDVPAHREVAGQAARLVVATDPEAWAEALLEMAGDGRLRTRMARLGRERAGGFTWERSARAVLGALEAAANVPR